MSACHGDCYQGRLCTCAPAASRHMTHREDNALLDLVDARVRDSEEAGNALQIAAGVIACIGIVLGAFVVLHFGVPM